MVPSFVFPSSKSVKFPYATPYPQQLDFMDALLSGLRDGQKVLMLESPTGTGKSLSLASSAMAWLRYQEQKDLADEPETEDGTTRNSQAGDGGGDADNWLDNWKSSEETQQEHNDAAVRDTARSSRKQLMQEINQVRDKLVNIPPERIRERRANLARTAVTAAKMKERKFL